MLVAFVAPEMRFTHGLAPAPLAPATTRSARPLRVNTFATARASTYAVIARTGSAVAVNSAASASSVENRAACCADVAADIGAAGCENMAFIAKSWCSSPALAIRAQNVSADTSLSP